MNNENYYTPKLEEFYIGFEYEITNGYTWTKKFFTHEDFNTFLYQNLDNAIKQKYIRVKYLDQEDIENLGFITYDDNLYNKNEYQIDFDRLVRKQNQGIGLVIYHEEAGQIFQGYIKNKSELKKILKQLGI